MKIYWHDMKEISYCIDILEVFILQGIFMMTRRADSGI